MEIETYIKSSHFYEIASIVPLCGAILTWFYLNLSNKTNSGVATENGIVLRVWSAVLLLLIMLCYFIHVALSPITTITALLLVISGSFVSFPVAQNVFHISASCSWIGCFDMYVRLSPQHSFGHDVYLRWIVVIFMTTSVVMRGVLGNKWQFGHMSFKYIGFPLVCLYYWGFEMPVCDAMGERSGLSCELSQQPPPRLASCGIDVHYRIYGFVSIVAIHVIYGHIMSLFFVDGCREDRTPSELERGGTDSVGEQQRVRDSGNEQTEMDSSHSAGPQVIHMSSSVKAQGVLPTDLVEISEQEAIDIVQKGLLNFKTKRAS